MAAAVAAVPYDVVSAADARTLVDGNELSFLRVSRAEVELPPGTDPCADVVYAAAAANFARLRATAPLVEEEAPSLYVYRLRMGSHEQSGVAGCFSVDEYERDVILKHERTRRDKEDDRTRHILELRAQTGPVLLTYRATSEVDAMVARAMAAAPLFDFTAPDGIVHTLWQTTEADCDALIAALGRTLVLYIADGHHRAASAMRARAALREATDGGGPLEADTFLAVAFPDDQVQVLPYHRLVGDLGGRTSADVLDALRAIGSSDHNRKPAIRAGFLHVRASAPVNASDLTVNAGLRTGLRALWRRLTTTLASRAAHNLPVLRPSRCLSQVVLRRRSYDPSAAGAMRHAPRSGPCGRGHARTIPATRSWPTGGPVRGGKRRSANVETTQP